MQVKHQLKKENKLLVETTTPNVTHARLFIIGLVLNVTPRVYNRHAAPTCNIHTYQWPKHLGWSNNCNSDPRSTTTANSRVPIVLSRPNRSRRFATARAPHVTECHHFLRHFPRPTPGTNIPRPNVRCRRWTGCCPPNQLSSSIRSTAHRECHPHSNNAPIRPRQHW